MLCTVKALCLQVEARQHNILTSHSSSFTSKQHKLFAVPTKLFQKQRQSNIHTKVANSTYDNVLLIPYYDRLTLCQMD